MSCLCRVSSHLDATSESSLRSALRSQAPDVRCVILKPFSTIALHLRNCVLNACAVEDSVRCDHNTGPILPGAAVDVYWLWLRAGDRQEVRHVVVYFLGSEHNQGLPIRHSKVVDLSSGDAWNYRVSKRLPVVQEPFEIDDRLHADLDKGCGAGFVGPRASPQASAESLRKNSELVGQVGSRMLGRLLRLAWRHSQAARRSTEQHGPGQRDSTEYRLHFGFLVLPNVRNDAHE